MPARDPPTLRQQYNQKRQWATSYDTLLANSYVQEKHDQVERTHLLKMAFFPRCHSFPRFRTWRDVDAETRGENEKHLLRHNREIVRKHYPQPHYWGTSAVKGDSYAGENGVILTKLMQPVRGNVSTGYFCARSGWSNHAPAIKPRGM